MESVNKKDTSLINKDEFEDFRARAYSGGFLTLAHLRRNKEKKGSICLEKSTNQGIVPIPKNKAECVCLDGILLKKCYISEKKTSFITITELNNQIDESSLNKNTNIPKLISSYFNVVKEKEEMRPRFNSVPSKKSAPQKFSSPSGRSHESFDEQLSQRESKSSNSKWLSSCLQHYFSQRPEKKQTESFSKSSSKEKTRDSFLKSDWTELNDVGFVEKQRIAVIGCKGVGKTSICSAFLDQKRVNQSVWLMKTQKSKWGQTPKVSEPSCCTLLHFKQSFSFMTSQSYEPIIAAQFFETTNPRSSFPPADLYLIVYSVENRKSFQVALDKLFELRYPLHGNLHHNNHNSFNNLSSLAYSSPNNSCHINNNLLIVLVANKVDLVRSRVISEEEGLSASKSHNCQLFIEISSEIDHQISSLMIQCLHLLGNKKGFLEKKSIQPDQLQTSPTRKSGITFNSLSADNSKLHYSKQFEFNDRKTCLKQKEEKIKNKKLSFASCFLDNQTPDKNFDERKNLNFILSNKNNNSYLSQNNFSQIKTNYKKT